MKLASKFFQRLFVALFGVFLAAGYQPHSHQLCQGYVPENDHYIPVGREAFGGITETIFNQVIAKIESLYRPEVARYGGQLQIVRNWADGTVNAYARREGSVFKIEMFGGLARHQETTADGLALVLCHELGHHIGGVPRYRENPWASTEGQSDYFATLKCLRFVFAEDDNQAIVAGLNVPEAAKNQCRSQWQENTPDYWLCLRSAMAGLSGSRLFWSLSGASAQVPDFARPDQTRVSQTYESHPAYQCRLDTYFQGSLCSVDERVEIGQQDAQTGTCHDYENQESGVRPLCWYYAGNVSPNPNPDPGPNPGQAPPPLLSGLRKLRVQNPQFIIPVNLDVTRMSGAQGVLLEISKPNQQFSNPGGNRPDPVNGLGYESARGTSHVYRLLPARQLPGWGVYQIRLMALDAQGRPVGNFSDSSVLMLFP